MSAVEHRPTNRQAVQPSSSPTTPASETSATSTAPASATSTAPASATSTAPASATSTAPASATSTAPADSAPPNTKKRKSASKAGSAQNSTCKNFQPFLVSSNVVQDDAHRRDSDQSGNNNDDDEQDNVDCRSSALNSLFHCRLKEIVRDNAGFFWTAGKFVWYEIMLLSLLGLVISRLVQLCKQYISDEPFVWEDRGLWQTLLLIPATPITALVIIWILSITNLLSIKPVIGNTWTSAVVPIAFLLGLFPHLGYDILQGLAKGIFNRPLRAWQASIRRPTSALAGGPPLADDRPSLDRLAAIIRQRFTAPFR